VKSYRLEVIVAVKILWACPGASWGRWQSFKVRLDWGKEGEEI
jgi:hypothetical protein